LKEDAEKVLSWAEKVLSWADRKHLQLNVTKTKLMLLGRKKREEKLNGIRVTMGEQEIQSRSVKCLGIVLGDCLTWREQIESIRRKWMETPVNHAMGVYLKAVDFIYVIPAFDV